MHSSERSQYQKLRASMGQGLKKLVSCAASTEQREDGSGAEYIQRNHPPNGANEQLDEEGASVHCTSTLAHTGRAELYNSEESAEVTHTESEVIVQRDSERRRVEDGQHLQRNHPTLDMHTIMHQQPTASDCTSTLGQTDSNDPMILSSVLNSEVCDIHQQEESCIAQGSEQDADLLRIINKWNVEARERPLKILVAGRGGVGKSTLINRLLGIQYVPACNTGMAVTQVVTSYREARYGIELEFFDTPGMEDLQIPDHRIVAEMSEATNKAIDLTFYCASLQNRVDKADQRIITLLTQVFGKRLWTKAIFVLTFANLFDESSQQGMSHQQYCELCTNTTERLQKIVKKAMRKSRSAEERARSIPTVTAGYEHPEIKHEKCINWEKRLVLHALEKAEPSAAIALLEIKYGTGVTGMIINAASATRSARMNVATGAATRLPGMGIGAGIGTLMGAVVASSELLFDDVKRVRQIIEVKAEASKLQRK